MANKVSFSDVLESEAGRIVGSVFEENRNIKNYEEFEKAFRDKWNTPLGENAQITSDDIITLWNTSECKERIKENTTDKEYEKEYGDGIVVQRQAVSKTKVVTITYQKIPIHSHTRAGKPVKAYSKGYRKWKNLEITFLQVRKAKKISPHKIIADYNKHFKEGRTSSSLKTKLYRL